MGGINGTIIFITDFRCIQSQWLIKAEIYSKIRAIYVPLPWSTTDNHNDIGCSEDVESKDFEMRIIEYPVWTLITLLLHPKNMLFTLCMNALSEYFPTVRKCVKILVTLPIQCLKELFFHKFLNYCFSKWFIHDRRRGIFMLFIRCDITE